MIWIRLAGLCAAVASFAAAAAPLKATFSSAQPRVSWALAELDAALPSDWSAAQFLVLEFRASSSQGFDLGLRTAEGTFTRRLHPFPQVWVRAAIPLRHFAAPREGQDLDSARVVATTPRATYWLDDTSGERGPLNHLLGIELTLRPARSATLELRRVALAATDPGDGVLDNAAPLLDEFGQYRHEDWPGKASSLEALRRDWAQETRMLAPPATLSGCRYGGIPAGRRRATGFFRVESVEGRWWLIDPEGCRFWSTGVVGAGGDLPQTTVLGRTRLFASIPTAAQVVPPGGTADPLRDPVSFHLANLQRRFGESWQGPAAQLTSRRLRAWGLNTTLGADLNAALPGGTGRTPYVLPLPGWLHGTGAVLPDVYAPEFAARVERDVAQWLGPRRDDRWMIGYVIGTAPEWLSRESALVDRVLSGPSSGLQQRFRAELARADTPAARRALVQAAMARYLAIVNAATRRHAPQHLNLGMPFAGSPDDGWLALARDFDVVCLEEYDWAPQAAFVDHVHALTRRPVLMAGFQFGVAERGLSPGRTPVLNQAERAVAYSYYVEHAAAHRAVVGTLWHQWLDQPATGGRDGRNDGVGWIDITDRPYAELVAAAKATHGRVEGLHAGRLAPTTRRARATESGAP